MVMLRQKYCAGQDQSLLPGRMMPILQPLPYKHQCHLSSCPVQSHRGHLGPALLHLQIYLYLRKETPHIYL